MLFVKHICSIRMYVGQIFVQWKLSCCLSPQTEETFQIILNINLSSRQLIHLRKFHPSNKYHLMAISYDYIYV